MNAKISVFVICVEGIIYLTLCSLHDCTFKQCNLFVRGYYCQKHAELKNYKQRNVLYYSVKRKSVILMYKQRNLLCYYVKKSITEKIHYYLLFIYISYS